MRDLRSARTTRKLLLGSTALVSAGALAQQAAAADPIELHVGGYQYWATYLADNDDNPATGTVPAQPGFNRYSNRIVYDGELQFNGSTVLENGLEVGVRFELEGEQQANDQIDETFAYFSGSFGEFRVGNDDSAAFLMATAAPYLNYLFGANSPTVYANGLSQFFSATGRAAAGAGYGTFTTFPGTNVDNAELVYFTPVFNGFQFAASYSPDQGEAQTGMGYFMGTRTGAGSNLAEQWSAGARYDGEIGELGITAALGYLWNAGRTVTSTVTAGDVDAYDAGLVLYYGPWGFGGSYMSMDNMGGVDGTDYQAYDLGVAYWSDGAWSTGLYWLHGEIDYSATSSATIAGPIAAGGGLVSDDFDSYRLLGQYDLGPGIALTGALGFDQFDDGAVGTDYDSTFAGAGLMVDF